MKKKTKLEKFIAFTARGYNWLWMSVIIVVFCFIIIPISIVKFHSGIVYDDKTANIANTIGGIASPLVALVAVVLTFSAFYIQFQANKTQNLNFKIQQFENSFFELMRLHKEIVETIEINGKKGKLAFKEPNEVIRIAYNAVQEAAHEVQQRSAAEVFCRAERDDFAFKLVFYGQDSLELEDNLSNFSFEIEMSDWSRNLGIMEPYRTALNAKFSRDGSRIPVEYEHGIRLIVSPYFSHLYHTINFVHTREFLEPEQKKFYVEILVNQMSPDEQVTLFYLSISSLGKKWRELIKEYNLIKNVPFIPDFERRSHPRRWYPEIEYANPPHYIHEGGGGFIDGDEDVDSYFHVTC